MRALAWRPKNGHRVHGCSECSWTFEPTNPPGPGSIEDMTQVFLRQLQKEFEAHVCKREKK